jgi:tetratricopeptide (TPR) repeat protein
MGTPGYIAPEIFDHKLADVRTDQFAFCVSLYRALTGVFPFGRDASPQVPIRPESWGPIKFPKHMPRWLMELLRRGLAEDPQKRYPSMEALLADLARYRRSYARPIALAVAGLVLIGVAAAVPILQKRAAVSCADTARPMAAIWNEDAKKRTRGAFLSANVPFAEAAFDHVRTRLDAQSAAWQAARQEVCEQNVAADPPPPALAMQNRCLEQRLEEMRELTSAFVDADKALVARSVAAASELAPISLCADVTARAPGPSANTDIEKTLTRSQIFLHTGQYERGLEAVAPLAKAASEPLAAARAKYLQGRFLSELDRTTEARAVLEEAAVAADVAGSDWLRLRVYVALMQLDEGELGDAQRFDTYDRFAGAALERTGSDPLGRIELLSARANRELVRGSVAAGLAQAEEVERLQKRWLAPDHPGHVATLVLLGRLHEQAGHLEKSIALLRDAEERAVGVFGADHPQLLRIWLHRSTACRRQGCLAEAEALAHKAIERAHAHYGATHSHVAHGYRVLGSALVEAGRIEDGLAAHQRALAMETELATNDDRKVAIALASVGFTHMRNHDPRQAEAYLRKAQAIWARTIGLSHPVAAHGRNLIAATLYQQGKYAACVALQREVLATLRQNDPDHRHQLDAIRGLAKCLFAQKQYAAALPDLERGLALSTRVNEAPKYTAELEFQTAQALAKTGDPTRARALGHAALIRYSSANRPTETAAVSRWLKRLDELE